MTPEWKATFDIITFIMAAVGMGLAVAIILAIL
jgi:hypothetical protein